VDDKIGRGRFGILRKLTKNVVGSSTRFCVSADAYHCSVAKRQSWNEEEVLRAIARGEIEVRRSARRKKTVAVSKEIDTYVLRTPVSYNVESNIRSLTDLFNRLSARDHSSAADLVELAEELSQRYFSGRLRPALIRWVTNQNISRWASTTTSTGDIRISHRLQAVPRWVLETVIVHELVHLQIGPHSKEFHALANRHPRQADAQIYLAGFSDGERFGRGG
jgi:predicted metal-dependent hydrolase